MNKKIALSLLILGSGSILATVYASNTIITNTSVSTTTVNTSDLVASHDVNTTNLFVTGTCSGCGSSGGSGEGSFSTYSTIVFNNTLPFTDSYADNMFVSNNGTITFEGSRNVYVLSSAGSVIIHGTSNNFELSSQIAQSGNGVYKVIEIGNSTGSVVVIKNQSVLQTLGIAQSQFSSPYYVNGISLAISPNAKYIAIWGINATGSVPRLIIFQGS